MLDAAEPLSVTVATAIESHLASVSVSVIRETIPRAEIRRWLEAGRQRMLARSALGVVAIDVTSRSNWRLLLLQPTTPPMLIREFEVLQSPQIALEEAGITVASLVEALLDGRRIGTLPPVPADEPARQALPPSDTAPLATPADAADGPDEEVQLEAVAWRPSIALGAEGTTWLVDQGWQLGVTSRIGVRPNPSWALFLRYGWYARTAVALSRATISLGRHPLAAEAQYRSSVGFSPTLRFGLWLDAVSRTTLSAEPDYRAAPASTSWSCGALASVGIVTPQIAKFGFGLDAGVEVPVGQVRYAIRNETSETVLSSRPVRPVVSGFVALHL